ncbi:conserved hypothetical protein [Crenothrix polyspora]|uniref:DUF29 domain-containing protein n=2 Tax=Crenothrix polyspora TaxID=360316 RepID=A0A1R4H6Y1_9GAMM|nr:conserved hypothetical protein [Crenothrix polyspora]
MQYCRLHSEIIAMINYEQDFYGWTQEQAALLKSGRLHDLDIANLIEEVESMGRSEKRELENRLVILLQHLLKWRFQPVRRGKSWELTIKAQRIDFFKVLRDNPGLKPRLEQCLIDAYQSAIIRAAQETGLNESDFPVVCPWSFEQITDNSFYPD